MTFSKTSIVRPALLLSAIAMTALPVAAQAAEKIEISARSNGERITVSVPAELLETQDGMEKLYSALQRKAEKSCKTTIPMRTRGNISTSRCTRKLMKGFVAELDHGGMAALRAQKT